METKETVEKKQVRGTRTGKASLRSSARVPCARRSSASCRTPSRGNYFDVVVPVEE